MKLWCACVLIFAVFIAARRESSVAVEARDMAWTSTREINALKVDESGALWAASSGGVLRLQNGAWTKRLDAPREYSPVSESLQWRGQDVAADISDLKIGGKIVSLPRSSGTHISAVLPRGAVLWCALFGDGLWQWDGKAWKKLQIGLPQKAREITAMAQSRDGKTVWLGTRRESVWQYSGGAWKQHLERNEPFAHNIQFLIRFHDVLYASTLEDGLVIRDAGSWRHLDKSTLSSNAPRQMVEFQNKLYVRHSDEVVDCFDGKAWRKNVFSNLPRKQIISLAADDKRLYLGQWGGWSEWDGKNFSHHLKIPELQIVPLLQIFPDGEKLWLGTENKGLAEYSRRAQTIQWHDERNGLSDDWITSLHRNTSTLLAGTFVGGLAWRENGSSRWQRDAAIARENVTAMENDGDIIYIATRHGVYRRDADGTLALWNAPLLSGKTEAQALLLDNNGLWIGTREGLVLVTRKTLSG